MFTVFISVIISIIITNIDDHSSYQTSKNIINYQKYLTCILIIIIKTQHNLNYVENAVKSQSTNYSYYRCAHLTFLLDETLCA